MEWSSDIDGPIGTGSSFSATLTDGFHTITALVTDSGGRTSTSSVQITVGTPPAVATTVTVDSITYGAAGGKNHNKDLYITLSHVDDMGNPLADATNEILLVNQTTIQAWGGIGTTDADGLVSYKLRNAPNGCYSTLVVNIIADGMDWDGQQPLDPGFCK
jgi:hypothetical protein